MINGKASPFEIIDSTSNVATTWQKQTVTWGLFANTSPKLILNHFLNRMQIFTIY